MENEVSARVLLDLPRDQAWEKLRDLSLAHNYVPGIIRTEIRSEKKEGVGASRRVYQTETRGMDETVTEWNAGQGFQIKLHRDDEGPMWPFREGAFRYHLDDAGNGQTALSISLMFTMRHGAFGRFLARTLLAGIFRKTVQDVALSLKSFYETGEPTTKARLRAIKSEQMPVSSGQA